MQVKFVTFHLPFRLTWQLSNIVLGVGDDDDAEDEDWLEPGRSGSNSRKKRDKNSPRRNRTHKSHAKWKTNDEESHVDMDRSEPLASISLIEKMVWLFLLNSFNEGDTAALRESLAQLSSSPAESTNSTGWVSSSFLYQLIVHFFKDETFIPDPCLATTEV